MTVSPSRIRIGPAGWSYADWEGRVYPRPHPRGFHPLRYLARYVDVMELNVTFYRHVTPSIVGGWLRAVEATPDFRFLAKLHQELTHGRWSVLPTDDADAAEAGLRPLDDAGRLLGVLAQFPYTLRHDAAGRRRVRALAQRFASLPLVLELRHRSWFGEEGLAFVRGQRVGLAHIDLPASRDHPPERHPCIGDLGYVRLHGRNAAAWFSREAGRDATYDYLYDRAELEGVVERLREVAAHSRETVLVANNHYSGKAMATALEVKGMLEGRPPRAPEVLREAFPHLADLTRADGQQTLF